MQKEWTLVSYFLLGFVLFVAGVSLLNGHRSVPARVVGERLIDLHGLLGDVAECMSDRTALDESHPISRSKKIFMYSRGGDLESVLDLSVSNESILHVAVLKCDLCKKTMLPIYDCDIHLADEREPEIPFRQLGFVGELDFVGYRVLKSKNSEAEVVFCLARGNGNIQAMQDADAVVENFPAVPDVESDYSTYLVQAGLGSVDVSMGPSKTGSN